jgi:CMP-N-acetylneuraminic acid synthetase
MPFQNSLKDKVLCVIPARMGSTRIIYKNLQEIEPSVSLVKQALMVANGFTCCISTDEPELFNDFCNDAFIIRRPSEISDSISNVSFAIQHSLHHAERHFNKQFDIVVTLMPAIAARSAKILSDILSLFVDNCRLSSAMTSAATHPWIWKVNKLSRVAQNTWYPNPQKNSQDLPRYLIEHASIIVNKRENIIAGMKWNFPLLLYSLPSWSVALDIDEHIDLEHALALYPAMKQLLECWAGESYVIDNNISISPDT